MSIDKEILLLRVEAEERLKEANRLEALQKAYPDLRRSEGRWKKVVFCSKSVNSKVNRFDIRHNCGCCADSPLEIWPYLESAEFGKIYSDPPKFVVGEKNPIFHGDTPYKGWDEKMRAEGIPEDVIGPVAQIFKEAEAEVLERVTDAYFDPQAHDKPEDPLV